MPVHLAMELVRHVLLEVRRIVSRAMQMLVNQVEFARAMLDMCRHQLQRTVSFAMDRVGRARLVGQMDAIHATTLLAWLQVQVPVLLEPAIALMEPTSMLEVALV
jgi:hypothetical protein